MHFVFFSLEDIEENLPIEENEETLLKKETLPLSISKENLSTSKESLSREGLTASKESLSASKESLAASKESLAASKEDLSVSKEDLSSTSLLSTSVMETTLDESVLGWDEDVTSPSPDSGLIKPVSDSNCPRF